MINQIILVLESKARAAIGVPILRRRVENRIIASWLNVQGKSVLDLACGDGIFSTKLASAGNFVTGVDISQKNLRNAREKANQVKNVQLIQADALKLPFKDEVFDCTLCNCTLQQFIDDNQAISEMHRVTRQKGEVLLTVDSFPPTRTVLWRLIPRSWIKEEIDLKNVHRSLLEYHRTRYNVVNYYDHGGLCNKIEEAGFKILASRYYLSGYLPRACYELGLLVKGIEFGNRRWHRLFPFLYPLTFLDSSRRAGYGIAILAERQVRLTEKRD